MPEENCSYLFSQFISLDLHLVLVFCLLLFAFLFLIRQVKNFVDLIILFLLIGAGFLNLFDRVGDGCVVDPYNFFGLFHFNIPDLIISLSALTLGIRLGITETLSKK